MDLEDLPNWLGLPKLEQDALRKTLATPSAASIVAGFEIKMAGKERER
jgi:hypothetical protein